MNINTVSAPDYILGRKRHSM